METAKGDLSKKKHKMSTKTVDDGDCGDHYCDGHSHKELHCSCGFITGDNDGYKAPSFGPRERHLQDVILHHLGVQA